MRPNKIRVIDLLDTLGGLVYTEIIEFRTVKTLLEYYTSVNARRTYDDVPRDVLSREINRIDFKDGTISIYVD